MAHIGPGSRVLARDRFGNQHLATVASYAENAVGVSSPWIKMWLQFDPVEEYPGTVDGPIPWPFDDIEPVT